MARLPTPGGDDGSWGNILNDYLSVEHDVDGTLKPSGSIGTKYTKPAPGIPKADLTASVQASLDNADAAVAGTAPDANATTKGLVKLAGDLAGTAALPIVPGLSAKEPTITAGTTSQYYRGDKSFQTLDKTAVGLTNVDNTSDTNKPVSTATQTALNAKATATRQITAGTGLSGGGDLTADRSLSVAYGSAAGTAAQGNDGRISGALQASNNLSDVSAASTARANLGAAQGLTPSAVLTTATYTASSGEYIPADVSGNNITVTLPTAPPDLTRVGVKLINLGSTSNTVQINRGGSAVFNKGGGSTSLTLSLLNQSVVVQYSAGSAIWYVVTDDVPLSQLDTRYLSGGITQIFSATANGTVDTNAYCAPGSQNVASTAGLYTQGMVGLAAIFIQGGSGGTTDVVTTVQSVTDNNHLVLNATVPGGTGNPQTLIIGTDISSSLAAAFVAAAGAIQTLYLPAGTYVKTATITVPSNIKVVGAGREETLIVHAASTSDAFSGSDLTGVVFEDWSAIGPGQGKGTGSGVNFTLTSNPATFYPTFVRFSASKFGLDGIAISTPIIGRFDQVVPELNGRYGFNIAGAGQADGTSMDFSACFAAGNWGAGYRLKQMAYSSLTGCAADANGVGYLYDTCIGITEIGCGSEETYDFQLGGKTSLTPNGLSRYIFNSKVVMSSPYMINNVGTSCWIANGSKVVINDYYEGSPGNVSDVNSNPTISLKVDAGCTVVVNNYQISTAMSLAGGTTTLLPDALSGVGTTPSLDPLTAGQNTLPRYLCSSSVSMGGSQSLRLTYFTASASGSYTQLKTATSTTAAGATPTLCKMGLYSVDGSGAGALIASTASDTTLWSATNTVYTRATQASYNVTAGQRYALAVLVVTAAAVPSVVGASMAGAAAANTLMSEGPRLSGSLAAQSDLPASFTDASLSGVASVYYAELVP